MLGGAELTSKPKVRKHRFSRAFLQLFKDNPVFVTGLALPFCIVPSTSLQSGLIVSAMIFVASFPSAVIAVAFDRYITNGLKLPIYSFVSMGFVLWLTNWYQLNFPQSIASIGIYLPLAAVNTIMVEMCYRKKFQTNKQRIISVLRLCFGFAVAICIVSSFREIASFHTIYNITISAQFFRFNAFALPFFGFLLIGFLSAVLKKLNRLMGKRVASDSVERVGIEYEL